MRPVENVTNIEEARDKRKRAVMQEFHRNFLAISTLTAGQTMREAIHTNPSFQETAEDLDTAIEELLLLGLGKAGISAEEWKQFIQTEYQSENE